MSSLSCSSRALAFVLMLGASPAFAADISVGNFVWNDLNGNGIQDAGEPGLADVTVQLWNGAKNQLIDSTTTNANGNYTLVAPGPGDYRVRVILPGAQDQFSPKDQTSDTQDSDVNPSGVDTGFTDVYTFPSNLISISSIDAGIVKYVPPPPPMPVQVGNFVWDDRDGDGIQDAGEPGLANVTVQLWNPEKNQLIDSTTTNANGNYTLVAPEPGDYRVRVVLPSAQDQFSPKNQTGDTQDSDINPSGVDTGFTDVYTFASNVISISSIDAGIIKALVQRSFVSPNGSDSALCTRTEPCRSFDRAIARTAADGEVVVLASAGYGPAAIDKPIAISAPEGVYAGITVSSGSGVIVSSGSGRVTLRGLTINGLGGTRGIELVSAEALYVERCTVSGFSLAGLDAQPGVSAAVSVRGSVFRDNANGIIAARPVLGAVRIDVADSQFERNTSGLRIGGFGASGTIRRSAFTGNTTAIAVVPTVPGTIARLDVRRATIAGNGVGMTTGGTIGTSATSTLTASLVSGNGAVGVESQIGGSTFVSATTITRNAIGVLAAGGVNMSFDDNRVVGNAIDGGFTSTLPLQ